MRARAVDDDLVGTLVTPRGAGPWPGVIVLAGSAGGVPEHHARRLAEDGLAALALAYFGAPPLPRTLVEVPLEYLERAARRLRDSGQVGGPAIGLVGGSKGAELALLCAATFPDLFGPVVAAAPSCVVWHGIEIPTDGLTGARPAARSSWSWRGAPVPFVPAADAEPILTPQGLRLDGYYGAPLDDPAAVARAAIPVEPARARSCCSPGTTTISGRRARMGDMVAERMARHGRAGDVEHVRYPRAGHTVLPPRPAGAPDPSSGLDLGGDPDATVHARSDGWRRLTAFLARALAVRE